MALNINTNITNNLNGYLLDAKNVKGGFVVVEDWSDVESLPSSTKVTGSLIYVVGDTLGGGTNVGFYQCNAIGNWQKRVLGGSGIYQFASQSANNIDYSQTYTYTLTSRQQTQIGNDFAKLVDADTTTLPMLIFAFNDTNLLIAMSNLAMGNSGILSHTIIEQNNTQYIVNISIALDFSTITLSFSELQAGSGGGSSSVQLKRNKSSLSLTFDVTSEMQQNDPTITDATTTLSFEWFMNPADIDATIQMLNAQYSANVSTWQEALTFMKNMIEAGATSNDRRQTLVFLLQALQYNVESIKLQLLYSDNNLAEPQTAYVPYRLDGYYIYNIMYQYSSSTSGGVTTADWKYLSSYDLTTATIGVNQEDVLVDTIQVSAGSSTGGGSGKLYQLDLQLTRYDNDGETVVKWGDSLTDQLPSGFSSELVLNYFPIRLLLSETKVEAFKAFINPIIDTFNSQSQTQIPHITDINSIVSLLNTYVIADFSLGRLFLDYLIQFSDTALLHYLMFGAEYSYNITSNTTGSILGLSSKNNNFEISSDYNPEQGVNHDCVYSVNNTCTLTEYGTSGGGGASATKKWYKWSLSTETSNPSLLNSLDYWLTEETMNDLYTAINSQMSLNISTPQEIIAVFNQLKSNASDPTTYGLIVSLFGVVANYWHQDTRDIKPVYFHRAVDVDTYTTFILNRSTGDGIANLLANPTFTTGVNSVLTNDSSKQDDLLYIDSNAYLSITEETETISGGSSSSQPTIPERFSLAYNLVVNINQEQFANGSWTGDNNTGIRTFQYNGSNADEAKARELVEFLTGVNVLDEYNATKPTPCFVFCTQSNICWKLQWDGANGLRAYKVNNFPFVVKDNIYRFTIIADNLNQLRFNISESAMQDLISQINAIMSLQDPSWQNITDYSGIITLFDTLKLGASNQTTFSLILALLGSGGYIFKDRNIYSQKTPIYFTKNISSTIFDMVEVTGIRAMENNGVLIMLYKDPYGILANGLITNDSSEASDGVYIDSNASLQIYKL